MLRCFILITIALCSAPAWSSGEHIPGGPRIADCSKARDPARCEARLAARVACKHKRGSDKKLCMNARSIEPNCANANDPLRCSMQQRAAKVCQSKKGKPYKQCINTQLKKYSAAL